MKPLELEFVVYLQQRQSSCLRRACDSRKVSVNRGAARSQAEEMAGSKRKRRTKRRKSMKGAGSKMDPELWSDLQYHVNLAEDVYARLPMKEFFRLRVVCKEWNRMAEPRRSAAQRVRKPYFAIAHPVTVPFVPYHAGVLTLHVASGRWKWHQLPFESNQLSLLCQPFAVSGVVLGARNDVFKICDVHSRRCIGCIFLRNDDMTRFRTLAMAVDTATAPHTFKLILAGPRATTIIYDSASSNWQPRASLMLTPPSQRWAIKSCVNSTAEVFMWSQMDQILVYSLTGDTWSALAPPRTPVASDRVGGALGLWEGRLFVAMADEGAALALWELASRDQQTWRRYARIPSALQTWLVPSPGDDRTVYASFCDDQVLVHTLLGREARRTGIGKHFALFSLASKTWEKHFVGSYGPEPKRRL